MDCYNGRTGRDPGSAGLWDGKGARRRRRRYHASGICGRSGGRKQQFRRAAAGELGTSAAVGGAIRGAVSSGKLGDPEESSETPEDSAGEDASEAVSSEARRQKSRRPSGEPEITPPPVDPNGPEYQKKYPDMFVPQTEKKPFDPNDKVVYLTFDDGPSALTEDVLNILDEYGVKATFFVVAKDDETSKQRLREIADRGHAIGLHSYTHDYRKIYASVDAFLDDFAKEREIIYSATGEYPTMFRFPGGSVNSYNKKTAKAIIDEMTRRGYTYYDWNVSSGDAEYGATRESIYRDTITQTKARTKAIVLCHDTNAKGDTVSQLPAILKELKQSGYRFDKLDPSVAPINFPGAEIIIIKSKKRPRRSRSRIKTAGTLVRLGAPAVSVYGWISLTGIQISL